MNMKWLIGMVAALALAGLCVEPTVQAEGAAPSASEVLSKTLDVDPWGLSGAAVVARASMVDKHGAKSELVFAARSKRLGPGLATTILRFSEPAELVGAGFLQTQKRDGDDERFLYLPDLKRARRISGSLRNTAFMGTDLSYADLDRRDLREANATLKGTENVGKFPCFVLEVLPRDEASPYSRVQLWVRKDNYLPLKMQMYDRHQALLKALEAQEVRRVNGRWFMSKSLITNVQQGHKTTFVLEQMAELPAPDDSEFTVRALEKP